jgi:cytoskeleton protein RodZ
MTTMSSERAEAGDARQPAWRPGQVLAAQREAMGWTVEQVADQLKLAVRQVVALEAGDYAALPSPAVTRGFVRAYAKLVKIDPAPLVAQIAIDTPPRPSEAAPRRAARPRPRSRNRNSPRTASVPRCRWAWIGRRRGRGGRRRRRLAVRPDPGQRMANSVAAPAAAAPRRMAHRRSRQRQLRRRDPAESGGAADFGAGAGRRDGAGRVGCGRNAPPAGGHRPSTTAAGAADHRPGRTGDAGRTRRNAAGAAATAATGANALVLKRARRFLDRSAPAKGGTGADLAPGQGRQHRNLQRRPAGARDRRQSDRRERPPARRAGGAAGRCRARRFRA